MDDDQYEYIGKINSIKDTINITPFTIGTVVDHYRQCWVIVVYNSFKQSAGTY